jgi:hypothetical protein
MKIALCTSDVTTQPMTLRTRKPLSGVTLRSKVGVETLTIHLKKCIPDQGMSRKDRPVKSLVFADGVRQRQEKLGE